LVSKHSHKFAISNKPDDYKFESDKSAVLVKNEILIRSTRKLMSWCGVCMRRRR